MKNAKSLMINCANCPLNDGMIYTSMPPKFRCTVTNEYNLGEHMCGKVKIFYDENHKTPADLVKPVPLNCDIIDETPLASSEDSKYQIYGGYLDNKELINLIWDVDMG